MRKSIVYTIIASILLYYTVNKEARDKGMMAVKKCVNTMKKSKSFPIEEAGVPEVDNIENAKMVDEGSQFGVAYFNHLKERE
ncbi:hypothetical protein [Paraliobacillus sp. JSM ZJ581]|uniref:hypothetical protein n=1 Tax=Paraliobacillus sp. JSM ZJ581 TaxID=3342118 RepID=UPI0035A8D9C3